MLDVYKCELGDSRQQYLASLVAAREVVYFATTMLALGCCPVFLLLDPLASWKEAESLLVRGLRVACYVLTPVSTQAIILCL